MAGLLKEIYVCAIAEAQPLSQPHSVVTMSGLGADRYAIGSGTFSGSNLKDGRAVSLISAEAIEGIPEFANGEHRRNLVVRGVDLDALRGQSFRIGDVVFRGVRGCPPCGHLSKLAGVDAKELLYKKGGLRADVVEPG
ncbi:MAG: MOSC domain-containing protein [Planctomycetota bacterium]